MKVLGVEPVEAIVTFGFEASKFDMLSKTAAPYESVVEARAIPAATNHSVDLRINRCGKAGCDARNSEEPNNVCIVLGFIW